MNLNSVKIEELSAWCIEKYQDRHVAIRFFEITMSFWIILHAIKAWSLNDMVADPNSICFDWFPPRSKVWFATLFTPQLFLPALITQIALASWILVRGSHYFTRFLLWFVTINIFQLCPPMHDGGTRLFDIILFIYIFVDIKILLSAKEHPIRALLASLAIFSIQFQISLVYYENAFGKLESAHWLNGTVFSYVAHNPEYSTPVMQEMLINYPIITAIGAYGTIFFQMSFPFMMMTRMKNLWLLLGIAFHLSILYFIGLFTFSLMMIFCYGIYLNNNDCENFNNILIKVRKIITRASVKPSVL